VAQDQLQQVRKELDAVVKDRRSALTKSAGLTKELRASEAAAAECRAAAAAAEGVADKLRRQLEGKDAAIARWVKGPVSIVLYIVS
jgi:septal ring factor EnvC (AmiA/AmiB activator)